MAVKIGGLQKLTLVDYPSKLACTVFLSGCNFRCPFCYSQELVLPEAIKNQPQISEDYFFSFLKEKQGMIEGCVLCGGEPTINPDLPGFCKKIKGLGFSIKLDTNGSNPEALAELISLQLIDYIAMDIKAPLTEEKYAEACGVRYDLEKIKQSIAIIKNSGLDYEFRTTIVPLIHSKEDIITMAKNIAPAKKYFLQRFRGEKGTINPDFAGAKPFEDIVLSEIEKEVVPMFDIFKIR
ncbi:MAG: anaerobic ribonucleoside-triphosphate reductase activating protein [Candidatus Pacebacteria bacterium]|nr:anaerobic ribonucleoside-triphosphate reductase activating protein [Candidatus Paceibacterota bacterium]